MSRLHVHEPVGERVDAIGGHYEVLEEKRRTIDGVDILYQVVSACLDTSCCGVGGFGYAIVLGTVVAWHESTSDGGLPESRLEPVVDKALQGRIQVALVREELVSSVRFA